MTKEEMIEAHMGMAEAMARKYSKGRNDVEDLISEAYLGLCEAAETYDPNKGAFSTYAYFKVRYYVEAHISNFGGIRVPDTKKNRNVLRGDSDVISYEDIDDHIDLVSPVSTEDAYIEREELELKLLAIIRAARRKDELGDYLLDRRSCDILFNKMLGLKPEVDYCKKYGVSKQRIQQIEEKILKYLKKNVPTDLTGVKMFL